MLLDFIYWQTTAINKRIFMNTQWYVSKQPPSGEKENYRTSLTIVTIFLQRRSLYITLWYIHARQSCSLVSTNIAAFAVYLSLTRGMCERDGEQCPRDIESGVYIHRERMFKRDRKRCVYSPSPSHLWRGKYINNRFCFYLFVFNSLPLKQRNGVSRRTDSWELDQGPRKRKRKEGETGITLPLSGHVLSSWQDI